MEMWTMLGARGKGPVKWTAITWLDVIAVYLIESFIILVITYLCRDYMFKYFIIPLIEYRFRLNEDCFLGLRCL